MPWILVMLGGALGSGARFGVRLALPAAAFPWATLAVNALGCFAAGLVLRALEQRAMGEPARLFLLTGVLGGFTTFSAFGAETLELALAGKYRLAAMNAVANLALSLLAVVGGYGVGSAVWPTRGQS